MSCHVMSCHVMSCHVMSCHVMSCHVILYYIILYYIILYYSNHNESRRSASVPSYAVSQGGLTVDDVYKTNDHGDNNL
jgi:hypothetical protein